VGQLRTEQIDNGPRYKFGKVFKPDARDVWLKGEGKKHVVKDVVS